MTTELNIRIAGEAGQGVQTTGNLLAGALAALGLHVCATQSYMSRIRGGLNWMDVRFSNHELFAGREKANLLVALSKEAREILHSLVESDGLILFDGESSDAGSAIPFTRAAMESAQSSMMANSVAAGAVFAVLGYDLEGLRKYLRKLFAEKGEEAVRLNVLCAEKGAELAATFAGKCPGPDRVGASEFVYAGSEALALSAATAGVKFVTAYPMTPSTATFTHLAALAERYGILVEQAEDELSAVHMACGASYAGVPSLTLTSGGGFDLMTEGVSMAGMMELPLAVVVAMRPGPSTGQPTRTAQQDLRVVQSGGHGEFPRVIYAPGTHQQCFALMRRALETAHKHQVPAFVLTDQFLQDMHRNILRLDETHRPIDRHIVPAGADYLRYTLEASGVSPRAIPGGEGFVICDSDSHDEHGHLTEDLDVSLDQQNKRLAKLRGLMNEFVRPELYGPDYADTLLVCWGSTYGPCREAVDVLNAQGGSYAMMHFSQVWPINAPVVSNLLGWRQRVITVEGNATAQLTGILKEAGILGPVETCLRYDGLPFTAEYIQAKVRR
jgi:2-oxoglutarate ferredoxin oxidoreductase subunit alpha